MIGTWVDLTKSTQRSWAGVPRSTASQTWAVVATCRTCVTKTGSSSTSGTASTTISSSSWLPLSCGSGFAASIYPSLLLVSASLTLLAEYSIPLAHANQGDIKWLALLLLIVRLSLLLYCRLSLCSLGDHDMIKAVTFCIMLVVSFLYV